jgi:hypothetical protein
LLDVGIGGRTAFVQSFLNGFVDHGLAGIAHLPPLGNPLAREVEFFKDSGSSVRRADTRLDASP